MFGSRNSVLAVDVGSSSVKILEVHRDRDDLVITGFSRVELAQDSNRAEAVAECLRRGKFKVKRAFSAVSGKSVIVRFLTMPRMTNEELNRAVTFEAEKYIPWPVDESQIHAVSLGDVPTDDPNAPPEMRVLLVASKKSFVSDHARMLIEQGLNPQAIDIDSLALTSAFELHERVSGAPIPSGSVALVDIGSNKTSVTVIAGGTPRFIRELDSGGADMTQALVRNFAIEALDAERLKCSPGEKATEVEEALSPVVADLANELNLSFDYFEHQGEAPVEVIYVSGGASAAPGVAENIERATGKKTHIWNPIEGLKIQSNTMDVDEFNSRAPSLGVVVGLAARES